MNPNIVAILSCGSAVEMPWLDKIKGLVHGYLGGQAGARSILRVLSGDVNPTGTRIIEHKHFDFGTQAKTVISREYSEEWKRGEEPYYPINDKKNNELYEKYRVLTEAQNKVIFGGRLGEYKYYDMDKVVEAALQRVRGILGQDLTDESY